MLTEKVSGRAQARAKVTRAYVAALGTGRVLWARLLHLALAHGAEKPVVAFACPEHARATSRALYATRISWARPHGIARDTAETSRTVAHQLNAIAHAVAAALGSICAGARRSHAAREPSEPICAAAESEGGDRRLNARAMAAARRVRARRSRFTSGARVARLAAARRACICGKQTLAMREVARLAVVLRAGHRGAAHIAAV